jgi:hypothetical protein
MQTIPKAFLVAIMLLAVVGLALGQNTSAEKTVTPGRYQLISATVQGFGPNAAPTVEQRVFMIDTTTGKAWSYVPSGPFTTPTGKPGFTPDMLTRVFVEELEGSVSERMQQVVDYFEKHPATAVKPR